MAQDNNLETALTLVNGETIEVSKPSMLEKFSTSEIHPKDWVKVDEYPIDGAEVIHFVLPHSKHSIGDIYLAAKIVKRGTYGKSKPILDFNNACLVKCISSEELDVLDYWTQIKPAEMQKRYSLDNVPPVIVKSIFEKI